MTLVEGEELQRLWTLVSELSSQLSANQQLCQSLQAQADELKGHALHSGTGYTLRRFNLDISKEKFESDLEKINAQLVMENHTLAHENKQVNVLLREYEQTLEQIMAKFRSFSHATQQHTLALTSHYETLLANNVYDVASADLSVNTAFSEHLTRLGSLVRQALREADGEASDDDDENDEDPLAAQRYRVGEPSGGVATTSKAALSRQTKKAGPKRADPRWYGSGGYTGLQGDPTAERARQALEVQTEEERLRAENEMLRELLRISADLTPEVAEQFRMPAPIPVNASAGWAAGMASTSVPKLSLGKPRGSRKSLGELPQSEDGSVASSEAASDTQTETVSSSTSIQEADANDDLINNDEEENEEAVEAGDFKAVDDAEQSSARGPTSMSTDVKEVNAEQAPNLSSAGVVVGADIADQIGQGGHDIEDAVSIDPIKSTTGNIPANADQIGVETKTISKAQTDTLAPSQERRNALLDETEEKLEDAQMGDEGAD